MAGFAAALFSKIANLPPLQFKDAHEISVTVLDRKSKLLRPFATKEGRWRLPVNLGTLDKRYLKTLLSYEDKRFYKHHGVDFEAMTRAFWQLITNGRIISGGSTLTMQLARLMEGRESRSIDAKITQIIRAFQLEQKLSKKEILTLYLTLAPYGGNLEGVRAASLAYFGKEPKRLSWSEVALLVSLPQSPEVRRPDRYAARARAARDRVLDRAQKAGLLSEAEARYAKRSDVPKARHAFPMHAAHVADTQIKKRPDERTHKLTIDRTLQIKLENLTRDHVRSLGARLSAAILVVNHETGEVRAHVGSAGYLNGSRFGAIDMIHAVRSPGSALKPFIYGLAFESGLAHPETLIEDRPVRFGSYAPENFDNQFRGTVTIREALQTSLNIPAVKVLAAVGPARLAAKFHNADLGIIMPHNLTVALGGVGIRLGDLTSLYASLARGGKFVTLRYRKDLPARQSKDNKPDRILSELSSWYIANILAGAPPPKNARGGRIAFKTGTSYGHRDAWALGFDGKHTIGVWVGRPDGTSTPGLMGVKSAAPLLFEAFSRISLSRQPFAPAPSSAIITETAKLPKPLIYFNDPSIDRNSGETNEAPLKIAFPPDKAELELAGGFDGKKMPVVLKAEGGRLPLTWLADGTPVTSASRRRNALWAPQGEGFHKFTVIDAAGHVDRITIRIR